MPATGFFNKEASLHEITNVEIGVQFANTAVITTTYAMFTQETSRIFLEESLKNILFPAMMFFDVVQAVLSWRQAWLNRKDDEVVGFYLSKAILDTVTMLAISAAVVGGLLAPAAFVLLGPILLVAALGTKSLYHMGLAMYMACATADTPKNVAMQALTGVSFGLSAASLGLILLGGQPMFAFMGIAAMVLSLGMAMYRAYEQAQVPEKKSFDAASIVPGCTAY